MKCFSIAKCLSQRRVKRFLSDTVRVLNIAHDEYFYGSGFFTKVMLMKFSLYRFYIQTTFVVVFTMTTAFLPCVAQTVTVWTGRGDGSDWFDGNNWDNGTPGAADSAVVNAGADVVLNAPSAELSSFEMTGGTLTFTNWTTCLKADDVIISGGTITLPDAFEDNAMSNRVWFVCENFTIADGSVINVDGRGYRGGISTGGNGHGPGKGLYGAHGGGGGSYGGTGGAGWDGSGTWGIYGEPDDNIAPGSGGAATSYTDNDGGAGGGAVLIQAAGAVTINGVITANGLHKSNRGGCGSGGGIFINCGTFTGTNGTLSVNGAGRTGIGSGGGGGGGRIAVIVTNTTAQAAMGAHRVTFSAKGGVSREGYGDLGTLYFKDESLLDASWLPHSGVIIIPDWQEWTPPELNMTGHLRFSPSNSAATFFSLDIAGDVSVSGEDSILELYRTLLHANGDMTLTNSATLEVYCASTNTLPENIDYGVLVSVSGSLAVCSNSWVYPQSEIFTGCSPLFRAGNLVVHEHGGFDGNGLGFRRGIHGTENLHGYGPGHGYAAVASGSGAGYGGRGGRTANTTNRGAIYGDILRPVEPGSGGAARTGGSSSGGNGGGLIRIEVADTAHIAGTLTVKGNDTMNNHGGGSGGGIFLQCRQIIAEPTSVFRADGGNATTGGGGGGGRIAIWRGDRFTESTPSHRILVSETPPSGFTGSTSVLAGAGYVHEDSSENGTVRFIQVLYPQGTFFFSF